MPLAEPLVKGEVLTLDHVYLVEHGETFDDVDGLVIFSDAISTELEIQCPNKSTDTHKVVLYTDSVRERIKSQ